MPNPARPQNDYDPVAPEYARRFYTELSAKALDRQLLDRLVEMCAGLGPVCDLGCGPGQVARYLKDHGAPALGIDLSAGMLAQARRLNPDIPFHQGDMRCLPDGDESWGGIAAFYSLIHLDRAEVTSALAELRRVLRPGGVLLAAFHVGEQTLHLDQWWEQPVSLDFVFFQPDEFENYALAAGFETLETITRAPYPGVEHPSQRAYLLARKPAR
ncbi:MAG: methyltransferase domain-containing protein [Chloroflexi bacterium]|jgi:SAM-dependent methyltransferase|nr:methyltransferase domain-containing protein [Anaerolineaceae bacterium]NMB86965.1 methyltransferase domain-containing protein [Chloroflexota bacterium]